MDTPMQDSFGIVILSDTPSNELACTSRLNGAPRYVVSTKYGKAPAPFVFARNANIGLRACFDDHPYAILLNDDALLETPNGFRQLVDDSQGYGLISAAIRGGVGNVNQLTRSNGPRIRIEPRHLCFIAVCIPRSTWNVVGELDERFVDYGYEDNDYSLRVRQAGMTLAVSENCVVEHGLTLPHTFKRDIQPNYQRFMDKWGPQALSL